MLVRWEVRTSDMSDEIIAGQGGSNAAVTALRVVVAEDDVLYREGVVRTQKPDLAVVDIRMPPTHTTNGLVAVRVIRQELPDMGILVLSVHVDFEFALQLVAGGRGLGYLLKSRVADVDGSSTRSDDRQRGLGRGPRRGEGIARRAPA